MEAYRRQAQSPFRAAASNSFTITPVAGYHVADVLVDGASAGAITGYTFTNVTANHTIAASFAIYPMTAGRERSRYFPGTGNLPAQILQRAASARVP